MVSPLEQDRATVKEHKIPKEVELHPRQKLGYLEEQLHQLKALHWRARVDMLHAQRLKEESSEILKNKGYTNYAQHLNEVQQTIGGIAMVSKFIEELKAENPGVKSEHDDSI